jgi:hypothetical protein
MLASQVDSSCPVSAAHTPVSVHCGQRSKRERGASLRCWLGVGPCSCSGRHRADSGGRHAARQPRACGVASSHPQSPPDVTGFCSPSHTSRPPSPRRTRSRAGRRCSARRQTARLLAAPGGAPRPWPPCSWGWPPPLPPRLPHYQQLRRPPPRRQARRLASLPPPRLQARRRWRQSRRSRHRGKSPQSCRRCPPQLRHRHLAPRPQSRPPKAPQRVLWRRALALWSEGHPRAGGGRTFQEPRMHPLLPC